MQLRLARFTFAREMPVSRFRNAKHKYIRFQPLAELLRRQEQFLSLPVTTQSPHKRGNFYTVRACTPRSQSSANSITSHRTEDGPRRSILYSTISSFPGETLSRREIRRPAQCANMLHKPLLPAIRPDAFQLLPNNPRHRNSGFPRSLFQPVRQFFCKTNCDCPTHIQDVTRLTKSRTRSCTSLPYPRDRRGIAVVGRQRLQSEIIFDSPQHAIVVVIFRQFFWILPTGLFHHIAQ